MLPLHSLLLRDLYTCFVGSCQNEVKHFSPISATISRESFCLVTGAGEKVSEMNNWCCEMDRFPSVGSWSHCVLHYLEWGVHCALSAIPSYCFFSTFAHHLQFFLFFPSLFSFHWFNINHVMSAIHFLKYLFVKELIMAVYLFCFSTEYFVNVELV